MNVIQRKWIDSYTKSLNEISSKARASFLEIISSIEPDDEEMLTMVQDAMFSICEYADSQASALASLFYDGLHEIQTGDSYGAEAFSSYDPKATAIATAGIVKDGLDENAIRKLLDRIEYEVKKSAGDCVMKNAIIENGE